MSDSDPDFPTTESFVIDPRVAYQHAGCWPTPVIELLRVSNSDSSTVNVCFTEDELLQEIKAWDYKEYHFSVRGDVFDHILTDLTMMGVHSSQWSQCRRCAPGGERTGLCAKCGRNCRHFQGFSHRWVRQVMFMVSDGAFVDQEQDSRHEWHQYCPPPRAPAQQMDRCPPSPSPQRLDYYT